MSTQNRYTLYKKVARGGMAEIYLGKQIGEDGFQRICCIKRILPHISQEEQFIEMFRDEAHIGKSLQHANIVRIEGFEAVDESFAIIMEFINGADLRLILQACEKQEQALAIPLAVYIIAEAARGLHYVHSKKDELSGQPLGIIHRDISPQNILVSFEGEVKVTDFGIADADSKIGETKAGVVKGKYSYMSPEQITAGSIDPRTDIFALSVVLWEALTKRKLFQGDNEIETIQMVRDCIIRKNIIELNSNIDADLNNIVMQGLAKNPNDRFTNAYLFEKNLRKYLNQKFPEFTAEDLGNFLKNSLKDRRKSMQEDIRNLLKTNQEKISDTKKTSKPLSPVSTPLAPKIAKKTGRTIKKWPPDTSNISNKNLKFKQTSYPKTTRASRIIKRSPSANVYEKKSYTLLYLIVFICSILLGGALGYIDISSQKPERLDISTIPENVKIKFNNKELFQGKYISTPITIKNISAANHILEINREGFQPKVIKIKGRAGQTIKKENIVLTQSEKMAPLKISLKESRYPSVRIILDDGVYAENLKKLSSLRIQKITFGKSHKLLIFPEFPQITNSFSCTFIPRSVSWRAPFLISIAAETRTCSYPVR